MPRNMLGVSLVVAAGLLANVQVAQAQVAPLVHPSPHTAELLKFIQVQIVSGRIVAESTQPGLNLTTETQDSASGRRERLSIDANNASPTLQYERKTPQDDLLIALSEGDAVRVRRSLRAGNRSLDEFTQSPNDYLTLTIGTGDSQRVIRAQTFWHLLLAEPEVCRQDLLPLLEILRSNWQLAAQARAIELTLVHRAQARHIVPRERLNALVQELASTSFSARRAAERKLADLGDSAMMYLASLRREDLDAEQWSRVQGILGSLNDLREDKVERSVAWLAGDPNVWLSLCGRNDAKVRRAATEELQLLLGKSVDFDPAGSAAERETQLERLRTALAPPAIEKPAAQPEE